MIIREMIDDKDLEQVTGGLFDFYPTYNVIIYTHADGSKTQHKILNYKEAWKMSNLLHADFVPEDEILKQMIAAGYVAG